MKKFYTYATVQGNSILHRYVDEDGIRRTVKEQFAPTLFTRVVEELQYKSIEGYNLKPVEFDTIRDAKSFLDEYKDVIGMDFYGETSYEYQFISETYKGELQYDPSKILGFLFDIEVFTPKSAEYGFPNATDALSPIVSIALYNTMQKNMVVWGIHPRQEWERRKSIVLDDLPFPVEYKQLPSEKDLLLDFISYWSQDYPDYISAWNGDIFDFPYIVNRIERKLGMQMTNKLSPFGKIHKREVKTKYGEHELVDIKGVTALDYMELYKKHIFTPRESYSLDFIAEEELSMNKLTYEGDLNELYMNDYQTYIDYNIQDTALLVFLEDKLKLFDITFSLAYYAKVNYTETLGTVKIWEILMYNYLKENNVISPLSRPTVNKNQNFAGAFVRAPVAGKHRWVISLDLNSLYPHLIQQYNLGAETIVENKEQWMKEMGTQASVDNIIDKKIDTSKLAFHDVCMSVNGEFFSTKQKSFLSRVMADLYAGRKADKKKMIAKKKELEVATDDAIKAQLKNEISALNNLQMAKKILLNGGYGAIGNVAFKYFDLRVAEAITLGGQLAGKWIGTKLDEYLNKLFKTVDVPYTVYGDTDSVYVTLAPLVDKLWKDNDILEITELLHKSVEMKILPYVDKCYQEIADYLNAENKMVMEREVIAPAAIFVKKKKYTLVMTDDEGVRLNDPKLKVIGLEAVRSTTPKFCRQELKKCYEIALLGNNDQLIDAVDDFRKRFMDLPVETIALSSSCNSIEKYYNSVTLFTKGAPKHVKAALVHNMLIKKLDLGKKYQNIKSGDKIKYIELNELNTIGYPVIGFIGKLPVEFELDNCIDRDAMFERCFLNPLQSLLNYIEWAAKKEEQILSLEDYF